MALADIIQMIGTVSNMRRQEEAQALAQQQGAVTAYSQFGQVIKNVRDPGQRLQLINSYAAQTGLDPQALQQVADHQEQTTAEQLANLNTDAILNAQGQQVAHDTPAYQDLYKQAASMAFTNHTVGENRSDQERVDAFNALKDDKTPMGAYRRDTLHLHALGLGTPEQTQLGYATNQLPAPDFKVAARANIGAGLSAPQAAGNALQSEGLGIQREGQQSQAAIAGAQLNQAGEIARGQLDLGMLGVTERDNASLRATQARLQKATAATNTQKEMMANIAKVTGQAQTAAGYKFYMDAIEGQYNSLHGAGTFKKDFGANPSFTPGNIQRMFQKMGL